MLVNRIYFRGIKTFQAGCAVFILLTILSGCVSLGKIQIHSVLVSNSPWIVDLEVVGVDNQAEVVIQMPSVSTDLTRAVHQQIPAKQRVDGVYSARVLLDDPTIDPDRTITVELIELGHARRSISFPFPTRDASRLDTPDWAKGLVWYQVFPERFRDGNPNNTPNGWDVTPIEWDLPFGEPEIEEIERAWNRRLVDPRQFSYDPDRAGGAVANVVYARRYGGDLMGVYDELESLRDQGFTGIYLCPIFKSRSLHKYDASDHRHIDPTLGDPGIYKDPGPGNTWLEPGEDPSDETTWAWTPSDRWFVEVFLPRAKSLGLRVVLDGVWNHVGIDHFAFNDVVEQGNRSPFVDWFDVEFDEAGKLIAWQGWGRVNGNLPIFTHTSDGDLAPGPKAHIMAVTRRWMDPNGDGDPSDGIDGWRLDVAGEIGASFWKDWRKQVRAINPEALIIGEIWGDADSMMNSDGFDGQMNYPFAYPVADWLSIGNTKGDGTVVAERLTRVFHHAPQHDLVQFNLMTSHDTERLASMMENDFVRGYDNGASRWARGTRYDPETVTSNDMDRALAAIAVMVASPGSVMIYNGDEYALPGADDPDNRRPIPWESIRELDDEGGESKRLRFRRAVTELLKLRSDPEIGPVLRFGDGEFVGVGEVGASETLLIRRRLGSVMVEFIIAASLNERGAQGLWATPEAGWIEQSERSRKYGFDEKRSVLSMRVLYGIRP
jgi:glycosidase